MQLDFDSVIVVTGSIITVIVSNWYSIARVRRQNDLDVAQAREIESKQQSNLEERVMAWVDRLEKMLRVSQEENNALRSTNANLQNENGVLKTNNILLESECKEVKIDLEKCLERARGNHV